MHHKIGICNACLQEQNIHNAERVDSRSFDAPLKGENDAYQDPVADTDLRRCSGGLRTKGKRRTCAGRGHRGTSTGRCARGYCGHHQ
ncbi:hypothetical protein Rmet_6695 (plasmid) [Cupriavidus metallidurans CH34]|uniref:Uncharacterized protein n=1 Tax=Cupriavidus metallidurans (strain ATCC 43123 / DSM 2839 / NBRC 102507 / CH34) TaxID=266264 RepID=D3DYA8_CUPMC|nr:hypothetical protein Rmet_6695 [Cupriavidus metallidurans CH34]